MIVSHARKVIFIKTHKTGGSSLEVALSKFCAPGDILTPLQPDEEALRRETAGIGAQNYGKPFRRYSLGEMARYLKRRLIVRRFYEHMPAFEARRMLGEEIWQSYYKFTLVRDPFDRAVSRYFYTKKYEDDHGQFELWDRSSFDQFLRYRAQLINENWRMYTVKDDLLVDFVVKYEDMEAGLGIVSDRIGLPVNLHDAMRTIRVKSDARPRDRSNLELIGDGQRQAIACLCAKEIEMFGY